MIMWSLTIPWKTEKKLTLEFMRYHIGTDSRLETKIMKSQLLPSVKYIIFCPLTMADLYRPILVITRPNFLGFYAVLGKFGLIIG